MPVSRYYKDWEEIVAELTSQPDRNTAIVGAALLDAKLKNILCSIFIPDEKMHKQLFKAMAPLNSLSAKARVAHAIGILGSKSLSDIGVICSIRNRFAHRIKISSFDQKDIADRCAKLKLADLVLGRQKPPSKPRDRYIASVINIVRFLIAEIDHGTPIGQAPTKSP